MALHIRPDGLDLYSIFHPEIFLSSAHGLFSKTNHMLHYKTSIKNGIHLQQLFKEQIYKIRNQVHLGGKRQTQHAIN